MTTDPEEKPKSYAGGGRQTDEQSDDHDERPTAAPPFDPVAFAQEVLGGKPSPSAGTPAVRPAGAEEDPASHGPHSRRTPERGVRARPFSAGRPTPTGLLSLANARIPSNLPPRRASGKNVGPREWEELATSPPPPLQQELIDAMARSESLPAGAAPAPRAPPQPPTHQEMDDRISLGDYTGALEIAEQLRAIDPHDARAAACADTCRGVLRQMYTTRIGPLDRVPLVMVARDQLRWLSIDHRAGFVLSLVDGVSSLEMILDVSGMPQLDALRILSELAQQRIIAFR